MTGRLPYLILDIDGVLQAPSMKYGYETTRVIEERHLTEDIHPTLWPRNFHGYGSDRRRKDHITFRTPVRVSPRLFEDLAALPAQVVMLTTWLENGAAGAFLAQATKNERWFADAIHLTFPERDSHGTVGAAWKLDELRRLIAADSRPFIWADDDEVPHWGGVVEIFFPNVPKLLIGPDGNRGLTREHVDQMREFLTAHV